MIYFTSDLHLGHKNCITMCNRPFDSVEQMDEALITNWNRRVTADDIVYIVGDLVWQSCDPLYYLSRLNGQKILIVGNHDVKWLKRLGMMRETDDGYVEFCDYSEYFKHITQYVETVINGITVTLCHYPMTEWKASRKLGSAKKLGYHIHGHTHNGRDEMYRQLFLLPHALNAGADVNGFAPVTFDELIENNQSFKLSALTDTLDRAVFLAGKYHIRQTDKSGKPYITHLAAVASMLESETDKCVAYLHDILEDTDIDVGLLERNFSPDIVSAVRLLTRADGEDYFTYVARVAQNECARRVKLADITHNMDLSRLKTVTEIDLLLVEKYKKAYKMLSES